MYYDEHTTVFLDGEWLPANQATGSLYDQTYHYGSGAFEGIRAYKTAEGTRIFKAEEHFQRLHHSAAQLGLELPYTVNELTELSYQLLEKNGLQDAYLRPLVSSGPHMKLEPAPETHVFLCAWPWGRYLGSQLLRTCFSSYRRLHPATAPIDAKLTGHYTNSILATTEAKKRGFDEAILLDTAGRLAEGPGANLFLEKDGVLFTPSCGHIFPGITRSTVLELCHELDIPVRETMLSPEDLLSADSAFFTGTAAEVAGIAQVEDYTFPLEWEESCGHALQGRYAALVSGRTYQHFELV